MDKAIHRQYNNDIFRELIEKYGINDNNIKLIGGFENFIYAFKRNNRDYILRISHAGLHRSKEEVYAELDFINYLGNNGVSVARAIPSLSGALVESADSENPDFIAVAFEKAKGEPPKIAIWEPTFFVRYGQLMGRMHRLAKEYVPTNPHWKRPDGQRSLEGFAKKYLPPSEADIIKKFNDMLGYLRKLPHRKREYGLIHQDLHSGNFFIDKKGNISAFDFDDCEYFWFADDIAIVLFYAVGHHCKTREDLIRARRFFKNFIFGYRSEYDISRQWLREIPAFLKLREIDLYIRINRSFNINNLNAWCTSFMRGRREKILKDVPYIDMDFTNF